MKGKLKGAEFELVNESKFADLHAVAMQEVPELKFYTKTHIEFLKSCLGLVSADFQSFDNNRLVIAFFAISGLDLIRALDEVLTETRKSKIIDWVYSLQVHNDFDDTCGFQSTTFVNTKTNTSHKYKEGHVVFTYLALCILLILGDDLKRVHKSNIIKTLRKLQQQNGSFTATVEGTESDVRFVYGAVCISSILDDWSGIDLPLFEQYILSCLTYDNGISMAMDSESHGGPTFCAIASLVLSKRLHAIDDTKLERLKKWLIFRQIDGFQGRPNKAPDTCYSFWVGATLEMLHTFPLSDFKKNLNFLLSMQNVVYGGFAKLADDCVDPLHTYLSLCALSLINQYEKNFCMEELDPALNISKRAVQHLTEIQKSWKLSS